MTRRAQRCDHGVEEGKGLEIEAEEKKGQSTKKRKRESKAREPNVRGRLCRHTHEQATYVHTNKRGWEAVRERVSGIRLAN